ncbi:sporulation integral membrane protein YtvI [Evansella cellulosilytica]|uniref:Sporulation integral membrane protein YtvI n=1 Tax=Evansella cellulosilytica (strain ATCC 21833 / DSM 2522 / FERM P-1141 / JCM 9156 / N-4) TaxID=649639 RepID=E6U045_EVAC2|nr:sporulation integral membrane protein YtvI [Evansella cellulosilytica]ADU29049.1 sporulation integral membrane protein YtvI [Evansella cellulosilytica DSM 2522]
MTKAQGWIIARFVLVIFILISVVWLLGWLFTISYPFWIAAGLVWMFIPLIRLFRRKLKLPNGLAVLTALLIGLGTLIAFFTGIIFLIIIGVRRISTYVPEWIEVSSKQIQLFFNQSILPIWHRITGFTDSLTVEQQETLQGGITQLGSQVAAMFGEMGQGLADALGVLLVTVPSFLIGFLFVFLAFYFIGKDWDTLTTRVKNTVPPSFIKKGTEFRKIFRHRVLGFLRAQLILMGIASIIVFIGLTILRVDYAFNIALFVGIAEILPYLGSGTILIPWLIYLFLSGNVKLGIGIAVVYGVTIAVRQTIEPKILSSSMNLNALAVLLSLFIGFQIFGILGLFIGPFILVILVILKDIGVVKEIGDFIKYGWKEEKEENSK